MIPTEEQTTIVSAVRDKPNSLIINALAGAAKTTTLALAAQAMRPTTAICLAFNKRIAEEMAKRLPSFVVCKTMNSVGHAVWGQKLGKRLSVNTDKTYEILKEITDRLPPEERKAVGDAFPCYLRAIRSAKSSGYIPKAYASLGSCLVEEDGFATSFAAESDVDLDGFFFKILDKALEISIAQAYAGKIDFDDQVYMSTLFGGKYPKYDVVMVDEAQDLSPLNHLAVEKMVGNRLIAVGDPNQAIYAFRGAHTSSMSLMKERFSAEELLLSTSFRCPIAVVKRAQARVPHMRWPDWAEEGTVQILSEWSAKTIPDGAAILCRNNAPLFRTAMRLIRAGRGVRIVGSDIGKGLVKIMKALGPGDMPSGEAATAIQDWATTQSKSAPEARRATIEDRKACILVFLEFGKTLDEAVAYAEHLFAASGPIQLMTGHKAKGGEWDVVFHLDPFLIPSKFAIRAAEEGDESKLQQEYNLRYVIETRSKKALYIICTEDYV